MDVTTSSHGSATIRVPLLARGLLRELAERSGVSMQEVLVAALESYRRTMFLERVNSGYAILREDDSAWKQYQAESASFDVALSDGLEAPASLPKRKRPQRR